MRKGFPLGIAALVGIALAACADGGADEISEGLVGDASPYKGDADASPDGSTPRNDAGSAVDAGGNGNADANADANAGVDAGYDSGPAPCWAGDGGTSPGVPPGSVPTASATFQDNSGTSYAPSQAIDGNPGTMWGPGAFSGWWKVTFPGPQKVAQVNILTGASVSDNDTFTVMGHVTGGTDVQIGSSTQNLTTNATTVSIVVTPGTYDSVTIQAVANQQKSWIGFFEVSLVTPPCK